MLNSKVESFLEKHNMNYLFLLCANLEVRRLTDLPNFVKEKFDGKLTEVALQHVANNDIPDYVIEEEEEEPSAPIRDMDDDEDDEV